MITLGDVVGSVIAAVGVLVGVAQLFKLPSKKRELPQLVDLKLDRILDQLQIRQNQIFQDEIASLHRKLDVLRDENTALQSEIAKLRPESRMEMPHQDHQLR